MRALAAAFPNVAAIAAAADGARQAGFPVLDAITPYPLPAMLERVGATPAAIRVPMAIAGFGTALGAYALQVWSAYAYPFNSGGRPLNSWPVFLLVPFEVGILAAALAGFVAFAIRCGLPGLHHPFFALPNGGRATQDEFVLLVDPLTDDKAAELTTLLLDAGARSVSETESW